MKRIVYDAETKKVICVIENCEGTLTGTPHSIIEGDDQKVDADAVRLGLIFE